MNKAKETAIELMIEGDMTMDEIAHCVKKTRKTLYNWLNNDSEFKEELDRRKADYERMNRARLSMLSAKAVRRAEQILDHSRNDMAAASVIKDVLDRTGYDAETTVKIEGAEPVVIINDIPKGDE